MHKCVVVVCCQCELWRIRSCDLGAGVNVVARMEDAVRAGIIYVTVAESTKGAGNLL
jgi:hypothetical protein